MDKLNELIEWMEGEKKNGRAIDNLPFSHVQRGIFERCITKAKELAAQPTDQVTDHDRASTVQEPDKSEWTLKILADAKKKNPAKTTPGEPHLAARWGVVEEADIYESQKVAKHVADDYNKLVMAPNFITVKIIP